MTKREVVRMLRTLIGEWSTDRDDIRDMVIDIMEDEDFDCYIEDCRDYVSVQFETEDGVDVEVLIWYELVGNNTWTITKVF